MNLPAAGPPLRNRFNAVCLSQGIRVARKAGLADFPSQPEFNATRWSNRKAGHMHIAERMTEIPFSRIRKVFEEVLRREQKGGGHHSPRCGTARLRHSGAYQDRGPGGPRSGGCALHLQLRVARSEVGHRPQAFGRKRNRLRPQRRDDRHEWCHRSDFHVHDRPAQSGR